MEMCSRIGLEGRVPRFHDESAAEDDTREWQLVGTMSPRLINIQPATPRPVTTTRLRFVTIESLRFRGLLPPREGGDTRENSSHLEYRVACAKKWTNTVLPSSARKHVYVFSFPRIKSSVHRTATVTQQPLYIATRERIDSSICAKFTRLLFSLSPFFRSASTIIQSGSR